MGVDILCKSSLGSLSRKESLQSSGLPRYFQCALRDHPSTLLGPGRRSDSWHKCSRVPTAMGCDYSWPTGSSADTQGSGAILRGQEPEVRDTDPVWDKLPASRPSWSPHSGVETALWDEGEGYPRAFLRALESQSMSCGGVQLGLFCPSLTDVFNCGCPSASAFQVLRLQV